MHDTWRKTIALLRAYPVLWAPYLAAELLTCTLDWLQHSARTFIFRWMTARQFRSVLGGSVGAGPLDSHSMAIVMSANAGLAWLGHYANLCIDTAALVLTAILIGMLLRKEKPILGAAAAKLRSYLERALIYAAKAWLLYLTLHLIYCCLIYFPINAVIFGRQGLSALSISLSLLAGVCYAWIMAPIAIRLLRSADSPALNAQEKKLGRYVYILVVVASSAIGYLLGPFVSSLRLHPLGADIVFRYALPIFTDIPYVFLYVALAVIANAELPEPAGPGDSRLRAGLRSLMPLHFQPRQEP